MRSYTAIARDLEGVRSLGPLLDRTLAFCALSLDARAAAIYLGRDRASARCAAALGPHAVTTLGTAMKARARCTLTERLGAGSRTVGFIQCSMKEGSRGTAKEHKATLSLIASQLHASIEQSRALQRERKKSKHDPLTGLRNLRALRADLRRRTKAALKKSADLALLFIDVDHLKRVNGQLGHLAGSEALARTAAVLRECAGTHNHVYRFGGDEFVVLCPELDKDSASELARRIRHGVEHGTSGPLKLGGDLPAITVSIGIATLHSGLRNPAQGQKDVSARLLAAADQALFRAKKSGRNAIRAATKRDDRTDRRAN